jgi:hypothetical protein
MDWKVVAGLILLIMGFIAFMVLYMIGSSLL